MMISRSAQSSLRALVVLAVSAPRKLKAKEISARACVPRPFLLKLLAKLRITGLLTAERGGRGGYRLTRNPKQVRLIDVVAHFDKPLARPLCIVGAPMCAHSSPCAPVMQFAFGESAEVTLSDIMPATLSGEFSYEIPVQRRNVRQRVRWSMEVDNSPVIAATEF